MLWNKSLFFHTLLLALLSDVALENEQLFLILHLVYFDFRVLISVHGHIGVSGVPTSVWGLIRLRS